MRHFPTSIVISLHQSISSYMGLHIFSLPISLAIIARICEIYFIIIITSKVWIISHCCFELWHETMVRAICLSVFLIESQLSGNNYWYWNIQNENDGFQFIWNLINKHGVHQEPYFCLCGDASVLKGVYECKCAWIVEMNSLSLADAAIILNE